MLLQVTPRWAVHCHGLLTVAKGCGPLAQSIDRLGRQRQQRERRTTVATSATTAVVPALQPQPQQQQPQQQQQQQQQRANPMHWLVHNGEGQRCQLSSGDWLKAAPRGAYTTARTAAGGSRVFELQMHLDRLAESARLMMQADVDVIADAATASAAAALSGTLEQQLRPRVLASLRAAVAGFRSAAAQDASTTATATTAAAAPHDGELKLTVLVTWPGSEQQQQRQEHAAAAASPSSSVAADADLLDVWVHISPLPPRPAAPVRAVVRGAPRQNAEAKDSEWVRQRRELEASMPVGVNEVGGVGWGGGWGTGWRWQWNGQWDGRARMQLGLAPSLQSTPVLLLVLILRHAGGARGGWRLAVRRSELELLRGNRRRGAHRRAGRPGGHCATLGTGGGGAAQSARCDMPEAPPSMLSI